MDINSINLNLKALTVFSNIKEISCIAKLIDFLDMLCWQLNNTEGEDLDFATNIDNTGVIIEAYADFCKEVFERGGDLGAIVRDYIRSGNNLYVEKYIKNEITPEIEEAKDSELKILQDLSKLKSDDIISAINKIRSDARNINLPKWKNSSISAKKEFDSMIRGIGTKGYGVFSESVMFKVRNGEILPVKNAEYQSFDQLYEYQRERMLVLKNTEALADGKVASNVLLYGDAGTGKSTTVKACAGMMAKKGVRLIEFDKNQVSEIPIIAEKLYDSPLKFIFFIDDLTFTENDDDYYALKGILEGNVSGTAPNILIYATSNRRHLVKESMADRAGDDIHLNDTLQETMSLSARFGLTITFSKPNKDTYLSIVESLAVEQGLLPESTRKSKGEMDKYNAKLDDLLGKAEAFAIRSNGRSPRTAKQFIVLYKNDIRHGGI